MYNILDLPMQTRNNPEQVIEESKLKTVVHYKSQHQSLEQFDNEKAASIYLGAQGTFN